MALNESKYRELLNAGVSHRAALQLADPERDTVDGVAVANPGALTSPANASATYTPAEVDALRADVAALHTTVSDLLASLRTAGVIAQ